jgi:hypothetical protein
MLHELLLVLSAHESSIFKPWPPPPSAPETIILDSTFDDIHPSERAALNTLAHLSFLHKSLRHSVSQLVHSHPSIVIRAVVSSIRDKIHGFQNAVEEIERMILTRDDSVVGAYDIVPLARLSTLLGEWDRVIEYLHTFVSGIKIDSNGAQVLGQLQHDQYTGYGDIAAIVLKLIAAGEEAWLRQVSSWILYGRIPRLGYSDFFIHPSKDPNISPLDEHAFTIEWSLWPQHLPRETGFSILFIGRALARIQMQSPTHQMTTQQILKSHLHILDAITFPLSPAFLAKSVTSIRLSLSSSVLSNLLPLDTIVHLVKRFRQDFLLGHGSLMITLLSTADDYLIRRTEHDGGTIKEADVNNLLTKAWSIVSRLENTEDDEHDTERQAYQQSIKLSLVKTIDKSDNVQFNEFLLGERIQLRYEITWPLDLFLSRSDVVVYNRIFAFLIAVKRCQGRLTSLWPCRIYPNTSRTTWTTITYALFFIDSLWSYFQATVIEPALADLLSKLSQSSLGKEDGSTGYDPESLRAAHTTYLTDLLGGLFLSANAAGLSRLLKQLLVQVDAAVDIIRQDEDIDAVRGRGIRAVVDECVRELEGVGERDGQGRVEKLLLALDAGQWFTENLQRNGDGQMKDA